MSEYQYIPTDNNFPLYKRRWAFLFCLVLLQFFAGISFSSFGQISDFYVQFFNSSHTQVDLITIANDMGVVFILFPLAWLIYKGYIGLKILILITSVCSTVGLLLVTISLTSRALIIVTIVGQTLCGIGEAVAVSVPSTFAALWFPENQVGTAISLNVMGMYIGYAFGFTLPPLFLETEGENQTLILNSSDLRKGQRMLLIMYGSFLAVSAVVAIFFFIFMTDKPPTPPTLAQACKSSNISKTFHDFLKESKLLFTNSSYVLCCIAFGTIFQVALIETLLLSEMIETLPMIWKIIPDLLSGIIMAIFSIGGTLGVVAAGKIVNRFKNYKAVAIFGTNCVLLSTVAVAFSVVFHNFYALFVSNAVFGFFSGATNVILLEMITQLTYPTDETIVNTWLTGILTIIGLVLGITGRLVFKVGKTVGVLAFQSGWVLVAIIMLCFISMRNRRLEVTQERLKERDNKTRN